MLKWPTVSEHEERMRHLGRLLATASFAPLHFSSSSFYLFRTGEQDILLLHPFAY